MIEEQLVLFAALVADSRSGDDSNLEKVATDKLAQLVIEFAGHLQMIGNQCPKYRKLYSVPAAQWVP